MATSETDPLKIFAVEHGPMQAQIAGDKGPQAVHLSPVLVELNGHGEYDLSRMVPAVAQEGTRQDSTDSRIEVLSVKPTGFDWTPASAVYALRRSVPRVDQLRGRVTDNEVRLVVAPPLKQGDDLPKLEI